MEDALASLEDAAARGVTEAPGLHSSSQRGPRPCQEELHR